MYDLHTHTFLSDGVLCPAELVQRFAAQGYKGVVLSDHVDGGTMESIISQLVEFVESSRSFYPEIEIVPGCEITHVKPKQLPQLIEKARAYGAQWVVVHGETLVEPVSVGTNAAAIEGAADMIAHPGLISVKDLQAAINNNVAIEITSRSGHGYSNGHVVKHGLEMGARLVYSSDTHRPEDILKHDLVMNVLRGAGLDDEGLNEVLLNTQAAFEEARS